MTITAPPAPFTIPLPSDPCPPAHNPEAILLWLYWQHLGSGRISKRGEHADPFWRRVDARRNDRLRLALSLEADPSWEPRVRRLAAALGLDLAGKGRDEQIDAVTQAFMPLRFQLSGALAELGERERAAEVLAMAY